MWDGTRTEGKVQNGENKFNKRFFFIDLISLVDLDKIRVRLDSLRLA